LVGLAVGSGSGAATAVAWIEAAVAEPAAACPACPAGVVGSAVRAGFGSASAVASSAGRLDAGRRAGPVGPGARPPGAAWSVGPAMGVPVGGAGPGGSAVRASADRMAGQDRRIGPIRVDGGK